MSVWRFVRITHSCDWIKYDLCDINQGYGLTLCQDESHVVATIEDRASGKEYKIKSRHLVACDGAKSAVRKSLGITSEGEETCKIFSRPRDGYHMTDTKKARR